MESILVSFPPSDTAAPANRYTRWNTNNISGEILNVNGKNRNMTLSLYIEFDKNNCGEIFFHMFC